MSDKIECSIVITQDGGKLHIMAKIPERGEGTIAAVLAEGLINQAQHVMNNVLGDTQKIEKFTAS